MSPESGNDVKVVQLPISPLPLYLCADVTIVTTAKIAEMTNSDLSELHAGALQIVYDADVNGKKRLLTATEVSMNGVCISVPVLMPLEADVNCFVNVLLVFCEPCASKSMKYRARNPSQRCFHDDV